MGHAVAEDDETERDGQRGAEGAHEGECCGCRGQVMGLDVGMDGDQRHLEVRPATDAGNQLENDEFRPTSGAIEEYEQARAQGHQTDGAPNSFLIAAGARDDDTDGARAAREREHVGKHVGAQ